MIAQFGTSTILSVLLLLPFGINLTQDSESPKSEQEDKNKVKNENSKVQQDHNQQKVEANVGKKNKKKQSRREKIDWFVCGVAYMHIVE